MRIVGGSLRGRRLAVPPGQDLRPTSDRAREALFNILAHSETVGVALAGATVLDLFAGTGAIAIEALSRGAGHAILVDTDRAAIACARANLTALGLTGRSTLLQSDATRLPTAATPARLAFLDPPYRSGAAPAALAAMRAGGWLEPAGLAVVEVAAREDLILPDGFVIRDERRYGAARLVFAALA